MIKKGICFFCILFIILVSGAEALIGGTTATPSTYVITITLIEFRNSEGTWVTFASGSFAFNIANASVNQTLGQISKGATLPSGIYDRIRVSIDDSITIAGSAINAAQRLRTQTGNPANQNIGAPPVNSLGVAIVDAAPATDQVVPIPTGGVVDAALAAAGLTSAGGSLVYETALDFTVLPNSTQMPNITVSFDVTNIIEFRSTGIGVGVVTILPPGITIGASSS